jgi:peptidoglycan/xylan/chitin deacetylase (PgdA/CDA1 family)
VEFGAHTVSHEILTNLSIKMAEQEILRSKEMIEKKLDKNVNLFAFPNGTPSDYSQEHINILKNNGFIGAVCTISKLNTIQDDSFQLGRLCIGSDFSSNPHFLALRTAGFVNFVAQLKNVFDRK